jgi:FkbM family methyltransferase
MIYTFLEKFLVPKYGKKRYQFFFETLYKMSLSGMNIGGGAHVADSGEQNALEYIKGELALPAEKNYILFDVGANIGDYSALLKTVFGVKAIVHSFEPSRKTFSKLSANFAGKPDFHQHNFALGDRTDKTVLYTDHDESGLASVYKRQLDHYGIDMNQSEEILIKTLDSFCQENQVDHIHFLKLDVEGHEKKVLEGGRRMLDEDRVDFIQFEFGGTSLDAKSYFRDYFYLLSDKYEIYRIVRDGVHPIPNYTEFYELFLPTNFLARRKSLKGGKL